MRTFLLSNIYVAMHIISREDANEIGVVFSAAWIKCAKKQCLKHRKDDETRQSGITLVRSWVETRVLTQVLKANGFILWTTISLERRVKDDQVNLYWILLNSFIEFICKSNQKVLEKVLTKVI